MAALSATLRLRPPPFIGMSKTRIGRVVHILRHAGRFAAEEQNVALPERKPGVGQGRLGREENEPAAFIEPPFLEVREIDVPPERRHFEIVHAGSFQIAVREVKAGGFDDVHREPKAGGHAQDRAGIAGNVRLIERDADIHRQSGVSPIAALLNVAARPHPKQCCRKNVP